MAFAASVPSSAFGAAAGAEGVDADADGGLGAAVAGMLAGNEAAFSTVYRVLQPGLLRYLTVLVGPGEAEDVASETWHQAIRDQRRFRGDAPAFRAWLTTIGRNRALDLLRRRARRPIEHVLEDGADRADPEHTDRAALDAIATHEALALIATLPAEQAEAILLRVVVGLDAKHAAQVLGRRPGAVRTAAYRGLRTLHSRLVGDTFGLVDADEVR